MSKFGLAHSRGLHTMYEIYFDVYTLIIIIIRYVTLFYLIFIMSCHTYLLLMLMHAMSLHI